MGGYVKMLGEENPLEGGGASAGWDPAKAFAVKALWARFLIVLAGPAMNLVLAASGRGSRAGGERRARGGVLSAEGGGGEAARELGPRLGRRLPGRAAC